MIYLKPYHVFMALTVCLSGIISGCGESGNSSEKTETSSKIVTETDSNTFEISRPEDFPLMTAQLRSFTEELAVNGAFAPDASRTVAINALSGGRIVEINARLGDTVKKNQLLLKMHSPDLANAIASLKQAQADELLAQRQYDRNKFLYDRGAIVSLNDLQVAEDALVDAKANTDNAITQIKLLNADPKHPSAFIELRSPISGVVVEQNITAGAAAKSLDATPNLFTIADLSKVWLLCDVYENNIAQVKLGDAAKIRVNAYPGKELQGKVGNIFSLLDSGTRSVKVRIELDNPEGLLRPGMFATAIFTSQESLAKVVIPATAIFRLHDKDWVFLPLGGNKFRRSEVKSGASNNDGSQQIVAGLNAGDQVVSNAMQLSAAARSQNPLAFQERDKSK